jgi:hypothetical protein
VPTEPLQRLATTPAGGDLISPETVFAANWGLWRLRVFNQLVTQQGIFNMNHAVEIFDEATSPSRRADIAQAAQEISEGIHLSGIGEANAAGNWYRRLTDSVAADLSKLDDIGKTPWWRYPDGRRLAFGDAAAVVLCTAFIVLAIVHAIGGGDAGRTRRKTTTSTPVSP